MDQPSYWWNLSLVNRKGFVGLSFDAQIRVATSSGLLYLSQLPLLVSASRSSICPATIHFRAWSLCCSSPFWVHACSWWWQGCLCFRVVLRFRRFIWNYCIVGKVASTLSLSSIQSCIAALSCLCKTLISCPIFIFSLTWTVILALSDCNLSVRNELLLEI